MVGSNTSKQREKKRQKAFVNGRDKRRRRGKVGRKTKNYSVQVARGLIKRVHGWHGRTMEIVFSSHSKMPFSTFFACDDDDDDDDD